MEDQEQMFSFIQKQLEKLLLDGAFTQVDMEYLNCLKSTHLSFRAKRIHMLCMVEEELKLGAVPGYQTPRYPQPTMEGPPKERELLPRVAMLADDFHLPILNEAPLTDEELRHILEKAPDSPYYGMDEDQMLELASRNLTSSDEESSDEATGDDASGDEASGGEAVDADQDDGEAGDGDGDEDEDEDDDFVVYDR